MASLLAMFCWLGLFGGLHGLANDFGAGCADGPAMTLLQLEHVVKSVTGRDEECGHLHPDVCDPQANWYCSNNCRFHTHREDCYRPIPDVMAEHPDVDGFCYFNASGYWIVYRGPQQDFGKIVVDSILALRSSSYTGLSAGRLITYRFEGLSLTTHLDDVNYLYDDLYGYALGFLQGQGLEPNWIQNRSLWMELSRQKCAELQATYRFAKEELILADALDFNAVLDMMASCSAQIPHFKHGSSDRELEEVAGWHSPTNCRSVTRRDFAKHHYVKCLLGYQNSAADMAYLNQRACLLEGNRIGHFSECPYVPDVDF
ncbi:unnamed protein product [Symbiodinium sp. CCMP2456]|nr:unnamed protein product [Symbiodinium sp. CCMP2456]